MNMNADFDFNQNDKFELTSNNYINHLVEDFNNSLSSIQNCLNVIKSIPKESYCWHSIIGVSVDHAKDLEYSLKALKAVYWEKVYKRSNIEHLLSASDKEKWRESFKLDGINKDNYAELPDFTYESVVSNVQNWFDNAENFFTDRVDSVFKSLSPGHLTNHPTGFNRKMVFKYWNEQNIFDQDCGDVHYYGREKLHDLRAIIMVVHGLPIPNCGDMYDMLKKLPYKTKHEFDGGLWSIQLFKNGNAHVWVDEETSVLLNWYLAQKYPNTLATRDVASKVKKRVFNYNTIGLSSDFRDLLNKILNKENNVNHDSKLNKEFEKYFGISVTDMITNKVNIDESIKSVLNTGLPCIKTYQFYPTPNIILKVIKDYLGNPSADERYLEPSAGCGSIAQLMPNNFECYEIYKPFVKLLSEKGLKVSEVDFLEKEGEFSFDKIVMNPPYSLNRCLMHFEHAFKFIKKNGEIYIVAPTGLREKLEGIAINHGKSLTELQAFNSCFADTDIKTSLYLAS